MDELRQKIDILDDHLLKNLTERSFVARDLGRLKPSSFCAFRPQREAHILKKRLKNTQGWFPILSLASIWREIFSASAWIHEEFRIALFGQSQQHLDILDNVRLHYGFSAQLIWEKTPNEIFKKLHDKKITLAIMDFDAYKSLPLLPDSLSVIEILPFFCCPSTAGSTRFLVFAYGEKSNFSNDYKLFHLKCDTLAKVRVAFPDMHVLESDGENHLVGVTTKESDSFYQKITILSCTILYLGGYSKPLNL